MIREVKHRHRTFWIHDENKHTDYVLSNLQTWEVDTFDAIDKYVQGGVFVDIGAWVGVFSIYAAPFASHVYAVEPDPIAVDMLERNIAINELSNVTVIPEAVWSYDGDLMLHTNEFLGDSMTGPRRKGFGHHFPCISTETLRATVGDNVDLVKLDTEGSETDILPGLIQWPAVLHVSVHRHDIGSVELSYGDRPAEIMPGGTTANYHVLVL